MKLYLKILSVLIVLSSCSSKEQQEKALLKIFNHKEISYLKTIDNLFFGQICKEQNQTDLNNCFLNYSQKAFDVFSADDDGTFPIVSYEKIEDFLKNSNEENFGLIWEWKASNQRLSLKSNSKFFELLKTQKSKGNYLINRIIQQQDIGPGDIVHLFSYPEKYDINDPIIRLTIAINIITQIEREKEIPQTMADYNQIDSSYVDYWCSTDILLKTEKNIDKLNLVLIADFLATFNKSCKNNIEYSEWANELLFKVIEKRPDSFLEIIDKNSSLSRKFILDELANPIHNEIGLKRVIERIKKLDTPHNGYWKLKIVSSLKAAEESTYNI